MDIKYPRTHQGTRVSQTEPTDKHPKKKVHGLELFRNLQLGFWDQACPRDGALDEAVGAGLRCVHLGVLAGVLQSLVPRHVYPQLFSAFS